VAIRLGILAAARIAGEAVIEPARSVEGIDVVAVAARDRDRAVCFAQAWEIPFAFGSYAELVGSPDVDAIYVATPAALHRAWAVEALQAGKHLLVEKPLAANADDGKAIERAAAASDRVAMVAFHWRYHPLAASIEAILTAGHIGEIEHVDGGFEVAGGIVSRRDIRWDLGLGGGAMMDMGCYPAQWARFVVGAEPRVVAASAVCPVEGIDGSLHAELAWPSGVTGSITTSMIAPDPTVEGEFAGHEASLVVRGSRGTLHVDNPLAPQHGASLVVEADGGREEHDVSRDTTYHHQLLAFRDAVELGAPFPTTVADGVATMELIDACYQAAGMRPRPTAA
jgi:predicted dehydrogenase